MSGTDVGGRQYRTLIFVLGAIWLGSALTIASCGGGSSSNGELCQQCGETDGFCQGELDIPPQRVTDDTLPCDGDNPITGMMVPRPCNLSLTCLRKLDSAQRRCFPIAFDTQFRCDGSRPNLGALFCGNGQVDQGEQCDDGNTVDDDDCRNDCTLPPDPTPTPTATSDPTGTAPTTTATPAPTASAVTTCGDGVIDGDEECDGTDLDEETCDGLCEPIDDDLDVTGALSCNADCTFNFDACMNAMECQAF